MIAGTASQQTAYPVEVSGWDEHEDFFVEKTELHWSEQSGKHILLLRPIVSGRIVRDNERRAVPATTSVGGSS